MKRKIELNHQLEETPNCIYSMADAKVNDKHYAHYCIFTPLQINIEFYNPKIMENETILSAKIDGTAITDTMLCLKIQDINDNTQGNYNALKIFGYIIDYIANNWYTAYKKPWYKKDWIEDPETKVKARVISMIKEEAIVEFEI